MQLNFIYVFENAIREQKTLLLSLESDLSRLSSERRQIALDLIKEQKLLVEDLERGLSAMKHLWYLYPKQYHYKP